MKNLKLLLYCTKAKPYLIRFGNEYGYNQFDTSYCKDEHISPYEYGNEVLNGKIVAECDYEVVYENTSYSCIDFRLASSLDGISRLDKSCLTTEQLFDYVKGKNEFYSIYIKNLNIFDEPKELSKCHYLTLEKGFLREINKAPQNMMYAYDNEGNKYVLISIQPQWLCKILNGEKTIEIRKKVLKEML